MCSKKASLFKLDSKDISAFIDSLEQEPFDRNLLKEYGLSNEMAVELLQRVYK